ncbi:MAG: hypothetical protein ABJF04_21180 [Reichenbachiella sp.]|uniref:hypothetical protein n=1 Tax=Reichenbachiella sp. TaxID=2184521 RepID=UPI0032630BAB
MKYKFVLILLVLVGLMSSLAYLLEYLEKKNEDSILGFLWLFLLPGLILYVLVTGDIHGWQPGPIGERGRILVTGFGSAFFWSIIIYFKTRKTAIVTKKAKRE